MCLYIFLSIAQTHSHTHMTRAIAMQAAMRDHDVFIAYASEDFSSLTSLLTSDDTREAHSFLESDQYSSQYRCSGGRTDSIPDS